MFSVIYQKSYAVYNFFLRSSPSLAFSSTPAVHRHHAVDRTTGRPTRHGGGLPREGGIRSEGIGRSWAARITWGRQLIGGGSNFAPYEMPCPDITWVRAADVCVEVSLTMVNSELT